MKALDRKLLRDLWHMKGQAVAIALVIVSGVATYVMFLSNMDSLSLTREKFYGEYSLADVFVSLKRAPEAMKGRIAELPGVKHVETRIVAEVRLEVEGFDEPVSAKVISVPDEGSPLLNGIYLRAGRLPSADNEAAVGEAFAEAHGFKPGDGFGAVINGRRKNLVITGVALSPEYVLQMRPGALSPDYKRYGIIWMSRSALAAAYDLKGAFNDLSLTLLNGSNAEDVIVRLDALLGRYGGLGAYGRKDQLSNRWLNEEFRQLRQSAKIYPTIFIGVAAFLLNVVIARVVSLQREQIAALKAFGYGNFAVGLHYAKLVIVIVLIGVFGGVALGVWFGKGLGKVYMGFYKFPYLIYLLKPSVVISAALISILPALAGTVRSVGKAAKLPPAEAMRPEPPVLYRKTFIEKIAPEGLLSQPTKIIIRNLQRRPARTIFTVIGMSMACAIMIAGGFFEDAVDYMVNVQFVLSRNDDMMVTFAEPAPRKALHELEAMRGVEYAEGFRSVAVRMRNGQRSYLTSINGMESQAHLNFLLDAEMKPVELPPEGVVLTDYLGHLLGLRPGDMLTVEVLEGRRPVLRVPVAAFVKQYLGTAGYMEIGALNRLMKEGGTLSGVYLANDGLYQREIYRRLRDMPRVAGVVVRGDEIRSFYDTQAEAILFFISVATVLAGVIAFGVVYNSARISLSERGRELASLRVLGYTRAEISYILLGELGILTLAAIPLGFVMGRALCAYIAAALASDLFRIPLVTEASTYSLAASVVAVSACFSGLVVRRKLDRLNLIAVLKTRE